MIINKEGKLFGKISIIDILVIAVILVAALGVYTRFFKTNEKVAVSSETIEYNFVIKNVRQGTVDGLKKLGPVYDTTTKEYMGDIVSVSEKTAISEKALADGSVINAEIPDRFDVTLTIKTSGSSNNSGYYTQNNLLLCAGSKFVIGTKFVKTSGEVSLVQTAENQ